MTLVAAQGMIPCRINERRCLIVIYKFYWSLPGVIVTISGENKTNYTHHTTASSQPITNGKSLWRWRWKSIFLMQTECLNRCAKIYIYTKSSWTSYRLQKYRYYITCIVYAYLQHVCKQIICEFFYSFIWQVSEAFAPLHQGISVSVYPCSPPASCHEIFTGLVLGCCWLGVAKCGSLSLC